MFLKKLKLLFHPVVFAFYPLIFIYVESPSEIKYSELFWPFIYLLAFFVYIFGSTLFFVRNLAKTSMLVSLFLIIFFSYGYIYDQIASFELFRIKQHFLIAALVLVFVLSAYFIVKSKGDLSRPAQIFNVIALSLVLMSLIKIFVIIAEKSKSPAIQTNLHNEGSNVLEANNDQYIRRDIYYFIFDQYSRADILKEAYNFDNSEFVQFLRNKGFYIADKSTANYPHTMQSLASSLNMQYVNFLSEFKGRGLNIQAFSVLNALIEDHKVGRFLKSRGYRYLHFGGDAAFTKKNRFADENINIFSSKSNERIIIETIYRKSILWGFLYMFDMHIELTDQLLNDYRLIKRERTHYQFDQISKISKIEEPTFVFLHMLIPHRPYVFDSRGNPLSAVEENKRDRRTNYIGHVKFLNRKIMELIETIISSAEVEPIIIIQSDEGSFPRGYYVKHPNPSRLSTADLKHKFGILNAYYLPGVDSSVLYPTITPVNTFRVIFNLYFEADFELLADENFATNYRYITRFVNVTDRVQ